MENLEQRLALSAAGISPTPLVPPSEPFVVTSNDAYLTGSLAAATQISEDAYEENDTRSTAFELGTLTSNKTIGQLALADGSDWYRFTTAATGVAGNSVSISFEHAQGDLQLVLYNDSGTQLKASVGTGDIEWLSLNGLAAGTYYARVIGYKGASNPNYSLTIKPPSPPLTDDAYEENDTRSTAFDLGTLNSAKTIDQLALMDGSDWYRFTTAATGVVGNSVSISFEHSKGDLQLVLYNASGTQLKASVGTGDIEWLSLNGLAAGTYYARVLAYNGATNPSYTLTIKPPAPPLTAFPDVAYYGGSNEWNLNSINAPEAWAQGFTGGGVVVAVVDTGIDLYHPDLVNQIWVNPREISGNGIDDDLNGFVDDLYGWDFVSYDNNPADEQGHGTHVAGTIAASRNGFGATGVAYDARLMPVRVLGADGSGTSWGVAEGIRYAAQNGAHIINLSLGGGFSSAIYSALEFAQSLNVLVVAAAGNESAGVPSNPAISSATLSNVISVGAHSSSNTIASFSNDVGASGAVQVDAPGVSVYSTYIGSRYALSNGTSMATPHVAGMAALALSADRTLTASELRTAIVNGADRIISGSDALGGINAAWTVALAQAGQVSANISGTASLQSTSSPQTISMLDAHPFAPPQAARPLDSTASNATAAVRHIAVAQIPLRLDAETVEKAQPSPEEHQVFGPIGSTAAAEPALDRAWEEIDFQWGVRSALQLA